MLIDKIVSLLSKELLLFLCFVILDEGCVVMKLYDENVFVRWFIFVDSLNDLKII